MKMLIWTVSSFQIASCPERGNPWASHPYFCLWALTLFFPILDYVLSLFNYLNPGILLSLDQTFITCYSPKFSLPFSEQLNWNKTCSLVAQCQLFWCQNCYRLEPNTLSLKGLGLWSQTEVLLLAQIPFRLLGPKFLLKKMRIKILLMK